MYIILWKINKCNMCNKYYTTTYIKEQKQTLKHIEKEFEKNVEDNTEQQPEDYFN